MGPLAATTRQYIQRITTMPLARSFLYVPANREKFLEKAIGLPSDAFIFDLEDSVPPAEKANARAGVREYAPKIAGNRVWVRVNGLDTGLAEADLDAVIGVAGLAGLFLPKVETRDEVLRWDGMIGALERARGAHAGRDQARALDRERARRAQRLRHGDRGRARRLAHLRRRAGRRSQHRSRLRLVDRRAGNAARALAHAAGGARGALRHAARRRVRRCARRRRLRARHRAVAPARLSRAQAHSSRRRSSRATGSTARARPSSTITRACWRRSTRRWRKAAPRPPSTAA